MQSSAVLRVVLSIFICATASAKAAFNARLQGQSRGSTTWLDGNLKGWRDLDSVPCRVYLTGGPANNKVIVVEFDHAQGRNPAIKNLCHFTPSANVVITSAPVLSSPVNSPRWTYTFTIKLLDNKPGWVLFNAKIADGAHLNGGSSVGMRGSPSLGSLQIHKIAPAAPAPVVDLALAKLGPAQAAPGEIITYTLQYSNKMTSTTQASVVQVTDVLPPQVTPEDIGGGQLVGNSVLWDIGNLNAGAAGTLSYTVRVSSTAAFGEAFTNAASISSSQADANLNDNKASVTTQVVFNRPPVANPDSYQGPENLPITIPAAGVLSNDTDADNDRLSAILVSGPAHGSVALSADGSFTYTPNPNYSGSDSFTYKANDGMADSPAVAVNILLLPNPTENHAPVAANDQFGITTNSVLDVPARGVLANDSDADNDPLSAIFLTGPAHGMLTLNADGSFQYVPAQGFAGTDTFTYKANDGLADSLPALVTILVSGGGGTNTPPTTTNLPPIVNLRSPTNGAIYIEGMDVPLIADASDPDGTVTLVDFLAGDVILGSDTEPEYTLLLTNVPAGEYVFRAAATDNAGAAAVSSPVAITVLRNPPYAAGPFRLNRQTGLFEQLVTITNPTPVDFPAIRLWIMDVRTGATVWNATGQVSGVPYIDVLTIVPAGGSVQVLVEYYTPDVRVAPDPQFLPEVL